SLIVIAKPIKFAILFTLGNILAVGSTAFLLGPAQQGRMMFDSVRVYASAIYIGSVILALICAILIHNKLLTLLAIIIEICALMWYSLSYIPFARRVVSNLFIRQYKRLKVELRSMIKGWVDGRKECKTLELYATTLSYASRTVIQGPWKNIVGYIKPI
ncbi:Vesicle transport protein sft2b, partial [Thalictrum thalictroides]